MVKSIKSVIKLNKHSVYGCQGYLHAVGDISMDSHKLILSGAKESFPSMARLRLTLTSQRYAPLHQYIRPFSMHWNMFEMPEK